MTTGATSTFPPPIAARDERETGRRELETALQEWMPRVQLGERV
jgi:hypothetical protein